MSETERAEEAIEREKALELVRRHVVLFDESEVPAFWISPGGKCIPVKRKHMDEVIDHPEVFGLTMGRIEETYARHDEQVSFKGKAWLEIIKGIVDGGWIRIKFTPWNNRYKVELSRLTKNARAYIGAWAEEVVARDKRKGHSVVLVTEISTRERKVVSMEGLADGILFTDLDTE